MFALNVIISNFFQNCARDIKFCQAARRADNRWHTPIIHEATMMTICLQTRKLQIKDL